MATEQAEGSTHNSQKHAGELGNGRFVEGNQRRQDKVIAAVTRKNPRLLLQEAVTPTADEVSLFRSRNQEGSKNPITDDEIRSALSALPREIGRERDDTQLRKVYERFSGDTPDRVRMRRIIALGTQNTLRPAREMTLGDMHRFVNEHVGDAVAFEQMIPRILKEVGPQGVDTYLPVINDVGKALYGSSWVYLEQLRLAQREAGRGQEPTFPHEHGGAGIARHLRDRREGAHHVLRDVARGEIGAGALEKRLEAFHREAVPLPNVPPPKYSIDQLRQSSSPRELGDYVICEDKALDREGLRNVLAGYNKMTGEVMAFKLSTVEHDSQDEGVANEEFVRDNINNPIFFTYREKIQDGEQTIRVYPIVNTDLAGYLQKNGPLTGQQSLQTIIQLGEGVRDLHTAGKGHFDLAAVNVFIDTAGQVHVADFDGLISQEDIDSGEPIPAGNIYIKPAEVYEGNITNFKDIDTYELATLLYESLTAKTPFLPDMPTDQWPDAAERRRVRHERVLAAHKSGNLPLPDDLPDSIAKVIRKGIDPDHTRRYQSMEDMLTDLLDAYDETKEEASESHLFRQPRLITHPERSPQLLANAEAVLDPSREMHDYLERQDPEYMRQLKELNAKVGVAMHTDTKAVACVPVAAHQEGANIYKTLEGYAHQTLGHNNYEVMLLLNTSEKVSTSKQAEIATTLAEIERAKQDFPDLAVRVANIVVPNDQVNIWNFRKIASDLAILRADEAGKKDDILVLSQDADNQGVSENYLKAYVDYFAEHPEKEGAVGNLQFDPKAFIRFPELSIATQFSTRLDQQGFKNGNVMLFGANSVMKASIYSAIGGYPNTKVEHAGGEQGWTGKSIRELRKTKNTLGFTEGALLTTSSRRQVLRYLEDPARVISFGDVDTEERMRSLDYTALPIFDWNNVAAATGMQHAIEERLNFIIGRYERGDRLGKNAWFYRSNLEAVGIQYRVDGDPKDSESRIVITDMREFVRRQKAMQEILARGETNMAKVYELAA